MEFDISCLSTTTLWSNINLLTGVKDFPLLGFMIGLRDFQRLYTEFLWLSNIIPHRTVTYRLRPVLEGLIIVYHPLLLGRLHPKGPEPRVSLSPVTSPGLSAGNVTHIPMIRIFVSCVCGWTTMNIILLVLIHVVPLNQDNHHPWMNLLSLRQRSKNFSMIWSRRQHYRTTPTQSRIVSPITN